MHSPGARRLTVAIATGIACAACAPAPERGDPAAPAPAVDHHVHVLSPQLVRDWKSIGVPFSRPDSAYTSVTAIRGDRTDHAAFLVSMAHIYGSAEFRDALGLTPDEEWARVREANDHVRREAARVGQALAFCAVALGRPYAVEEVTRCGSGAQPAGIKVHLPASGMHLGSAADRQALASVAAVAQRSGRPLLVHLVAVDGGISADDARRFVDEVVRPHAGLELYLAHLGGNGGYRASARHVVGAFLEFFAEHEEHRQRPIFFEMSGAVLARRTDGVPASRRGEMDALASDLRRLGLHRVLFGSDYPVFDPAEFAQSLRERLPITDAEFAELLANRAPALRQDPDARTAAASTQAP